MLLANAGWIKCIFSGYTESGTVALSCWPSPSSRNGSRHLVGFAVHRLEKTLFHVERFSSSESCVFLSLLAGNNDSKAQEAVRRIKEDTLNDQGT